MASWDDVRRIALSMPGTSEDVSYGHAAWKVQKNSFVWERPLRKSDLVALGESAPKGPILGVRTSNLEMKEVLLASNPDTVFTTPHFDGYAAVLVRLDAVSLERLRDIIVEAWLARAPKRLAAEYLRR